MLHLLALSMAITGRPYSIVRDTYGVPKISGTSEAAAIKGQGYADAQDRLWQMELSRAQAEGHLASIIGESGVASDESVDKTGYTPEEIHEQLLRQPAMVQSYFQAYAQGINDFIADAAAGKTSLPAPFAKQGISPRAWTPDDCAAIAIRLLHLFGTGGAGELRDWALYQYFGLQPKLKGHVLDAFNDIGFLNDPASPTTVSDKDDLASGPHPYFPTPTDSETLAQLKALPPVSIFQLLPAIGTALQTPAKLVAMQLGLPYRTGSYCIAVSGKRTADHRPILLSGPQMGFTNPSIVHESALRAPGFSVTGLDVPGVPGVLIGATPKISWGITSGVADDQDIFAFQSPTKGTYLFNGTSHDLIEKKFTIEVAGGSPVTVTQERTMYGPVVLNTGKGLFSLRASYADHELDGLSSVYSMYKSQDAAGIDKALASEPMSFNVFYADAAGNIGWRYCGKVPIRAHGLDPRLPTPANPANDWQGFISPSQMPHTYNPSAGIIYNWNTKPASWWHNMDTPVWGSVFRSSMIGLSLPSGSLIPHDVELVPWSLARGSETWPSFRKYFPTDPSSPLADYDGWDIEGSFAADEYKNAFEALRKSLFESSVGNFMGTGLFDTIIQPSVMLRALQGKTRFNWLAGRSAKEVVSQVLASLPAPTRFKASQMTGPDGLSFKYPNRGTYIQLCQIGPDGNWTLETMLPPGESEFGPHSADQMMNSQGWIYKPAWPVTDQ